MNTTVAQLLGDKGATVHTVLPTATVTEILKLMAEQNIGSVVVAKGDQLLGIFSERDYVRKVWPDGPIHANTPVKEIMTGNVRTVSLTQTVADCMGMMTDHRIRHLPVIDRGKLVGIISIGDIVKAVIAEQDQTIQQLSNYISGDLAV